MSEQVPSKQAHIWPMERIVGLIFVGTAAFLAYSLRDVPARPAAFPMALLIILAVLGLVVAMRPAAGEKPVSFKGLVNVIACAALIVIYVVLSDIVGFFAATILFIISVLLVSGYLRGHRFRYPFILLIAVPIGFVLSQILVDILKLPMP
jgi:peptidoglycan/LPS O-acetylase OafA/YrhL